MTAILGIDAAWTAKEPSGVALVSNDLGKWRCVAVAPSYESFISIADGRLVEWEVAKIHGSKPNVPALLAAARQLLHGADVDIVAIDMPISTVKITCRRSADNAISREFGAKWCSAHSPGVKRPGPLGRRISDAFVAAGYPIAVNNRVRGSRALIEVYPHPALLVLTGAERRLEYKIGKRGRRIRNVMRVWRRIVDALSHEIRGIDLDIRSSGIKARMKRYEDAIDAIVCAWVGVKYFDGRAEPYGDETAAVWCPEP